MWCVLFLTLALAADPGDTVLQREDIRIRDPFVLPVPKEGAYYLYGTGRPLGELGFDAYRSTDLMTWEGPFPVMRPPKDFWADRQFWAPEVHVYRGRYYMFATFAREYPIRGTQICVSDTPAGPFVPLGSGPQTPEHWQCLDGTLYIESGQPWMVFCHEWTQVGDGEIAAIRLTDDLAESVGEPVVLFRASATPWGGVSKHKRFEGRVTDGPWLHRTKDGTLLILWSTFNKKKRAYCIAVAHSESGALAGPWTHAPEPLYQQDGGHPMLFRTFDGHLMLSFHGPNRGPERPHFIKVTDAELKAGTLNARE